jgi:hypothetical protein
MQTNGHLAFACMADAVLLSVPREQRERTRTSWHTHPAVG